jgi:hypothetical protein
VDVNRVVHVAVGFEAAAPVAPVVPVVPVAAAVAFAVNRVARVPCAFGSVPFENFVDMTRLRLKDLLVRVDSSGTFNF